MTDYLVNVGIDYPPEKRAEPGDVVSDIPDKSIPWLLREGIITTVKKGQETDSEEDEASEEGGDE